MRRAFNIFFLSINGLLAVWLLVVYALYPSTHADYVLDFPTMIWRFGNAFETTIVTWWNDISYTWQQNASDAYKALEVGANAVTYNSDNIVLVIVGIANMIALGFKVIFVYMFQLIFWIPTSFVLYSVTFFIKLFEVIFNPSFYNVGQAIRDWWFPTTLTA